MTYPPRTQTMNQITVTQIDWDGRGNDRHFHFLKSPADTPAFLDRVERGYNMASTRVSVNGEVVHDPNDARLTRV